MDADVTLIARVVGGDREAFRGLVERYQGRRARRGARPGRVRGPRDGGGPRAGRAGLVLAGVAACAVRVTLALGILLSS